MGLGSGNNLRGNKISDDVEGRPAHIEKTIDAEDQRNCLRVDADHRQDQSHDRQRSGWDTGGANTAEDAHQHHHNLLAEGEIDAEELSQKQDRDAFEHGGAVLVGGGADGQNEPRNPRRQLEPLVRDAQRRRQGCIRRRGRKRHQAGFLRLAKESERVFLAQRHQEQWINDEHLDRECQQHDAT